MNPRFMQIALGGIFGLLGLAALVGAIATGNPRMLPIAIFPLVVATIAIGVFQMQISGMRSGSKRVRANIDAIAARVFDQPAAVRPGYDLSVTMGSGRLASFVSSVDSGDGFTTDGMYRGVPVSVASHVSTAGRQVMEFSHVYSYVLVDAQGADVPFRLMNQTNVPGLRRLAGVKNDAQVGDAGFDNTWTIDTDDALARDVYDPSIRARVMQLKSLVSSVSQDFAFNGMSILLTRAGLALRWPGDINVELAQFIRDLLLDMRERLVGHLDRKAAAARQGEGYRVVADAAPASVAGDPEDRAGANPGARSSAKS